MIARAADGTLSYTAQDGTVVSASIFDQTGLYAQLEATESTEEGEAQTNATNLANYNTALANAQISINAGRTVAPPPKPLMAVVDDATGNITFTPNWTPPLADLVLPPAPSGSTTNGQIAAPSVNEAHLTYLMTLALSNAAFPKKS